MKKLLFFLFLMVFTLSAFCATKTFSGTGDFSDNTKWDSSILPAAGDDLVIDGVCTLSANETLTYLTLTINSTKSLNLATYNLTLSGLTTVNGTLSMGISAGTGLTTAGLTFNAGSVATLLTGSIIHNSDGYSCNNSSVFTTAIRGDYRQTASGTFTNANSANLFYKFTIDTGVVQTLSGDCFTVGSENLSTGHSLIINGTLAAGNNSVRIGLNNTLTIGAAGDITGTGILNINLASTLSVTWNRATSLSYTGTIRFLTNSSTTRGALARDLSNTNVTLYGQHGSGAATLQFEAGTLKCKTLAIINTSAYGFTFDCATNNPSFEISADMNLKNDVQIYTSLWTKGTGTITLTGTSGTQAINGNSQSLEAIVSNNASTKSLSSNFSTVSLTGTAGTFNSSVSGTQRTLTVANTSSVTGMTFKDISVGAARKINAKSGANTNQGNTLGIVFKDKMKIQNM